MSCRTRFRKQCLFPTAVLVTVVALAFTASATSDTAPASIFELDGDSVTGSTFGTANPINCDWDTLNGGKTANSTTPTASCVGPGATGPTAYGFIEGAPGEPAFTTGGSKDSNDISAWKWSVTSTPDKDTLTHGYGASYVGTSDGDKLLIFGAERFASNGDSNIAIWFFQQAIGLTPPPPPTGTATKGSFTGVHAPGDILIVSAFTAGGGASTISVYEWAPGGQTVTPIQCPNSNYPNLTSSTSLPACAATNLLALEFDVSTASNSSSSAFAIVNPSTITLGWPYESKFPGGTNAVPQGAFYEGGIDLTALLPSGQGAPCFASFLFETRSSQAVNAVLKDFLLGSFPQCHVLVNKSYTCNSFNANGSFNYSYTGTVTNDGGGDLFNIQVTDTPVGGTAVTYSCGNLARGTGAPPSLTFPSASCPQPAGTTNTVTTTTHPASNLASVSACTSPLSGSPPTCQTSVITNTSGSITSTDASTTSCSPTPNIDVAKRCVTAFQQVASAIEVRVDYTGEVTNTGALNLINWHVTDDSGGGPFDSTATLAPGNSICYTNNATCPTLQVTTGLTTGTPTGAASYFPTSANVFGLTAGRIQFTDTVTATGTASNGASVGPVTKSAMCVICPLGSCPTQ
jgi:hypothetical protein